MGNSSGKAGFCGGCFSGLVPQAHREAKPDYEPPRSPHKVPVVSTLEEALQIERPAEGSWMPSPGSIRSFSGTEWASPLPRNNHHVSEEGTEVDFDLVIEDSKGAGSGPSTTLASQLDTDIPAKRVLGPAHSRMRSRYEAEQLIASPGSLPPPMSQDAREEAIRKLIPTATFQMLAKVPRQLLNDHNEQGQALRRRLARGATLVFISAGLPGKRFTFERAAALGVKSVIIEHPDSWSASMVEAGIIAKFIPIDMTQSSEDIFAQALDEIKKLGDDGQTGVVDGIATFVELSVPLVARLTEALGLPGHRPAAVDNARNKHATRAALRAAGLPTPRNALLKSEADIAAVAKEVGFPAVLKPVSGAASLGVKKVCDEKELKESYREIVAELSTLVVTSGALVKGDSTTSGLEAGNMIDLTVLMEQFLDGCEVDVDIVMSEGEWRYAAVADNGPTLEPYFNETWAVCPSLLPKEQQRALKELAVNSVKALGFTIGVFHVECKFTSTGPQLIEVNARMGGGQVHECNLRCWGVDLVEETIFGSLGIPCRPRVPDKPLTAVAYCYVNANKSGKVTDLSGLEKLRQRDGVVWAKPLVRVGQHAVGPEQGLPTWLADLFVTRPTAKEALKYLEDLQAEEPVKVADK